MSISIYILENVHHDRHLLVSIISYYISHVVALYVIWSNISLQKADSGVSQDVFVTIETLLSTKVNDVAKMS